MGDRDFMARLYRPSPPGLEAPSVVVDVHGGAWITGDRTRDALHSRALASSGLSVVSIDFRQAPHHKHPAGSADVVDAVRWVRSRPDLWGGPPRSVGLVGQSSGGHLALLAATTHNSPTHRGTLTVDADGAFRVHDKLDGSVDYGVALWPVSDPYYRYRYAKRAKLTNLVAAHDSYFANEAAMGAASVPRLVTADEASSLPPLLVVQPGEDANVPVEMTLDLVRAWQSRSAHVEYAFFPEMPHGFGLSPSPQTEDMIRLVTDFSERHAPGGSWPCVAQQARSASRFPDLYCASSV